MAFNEDQIKTLKLLLQTQSDGYKDSIDRLWNDMKEMRKDFAVQLNELQKSLEYTQKENDDMKDSLSLLKIENVKLVKELTSYRGANEENESKITLLSDKLDFMDDKDRRSNLIISGIEENHNENNEQCHKKTLQFFKEKIKVPEIDIISAYRIGRSNNRNRDIMVRFKNNDERNAVFRRKRNLKGERIYIREDFCRETQEIRKELLPKLKEARQQGKNAFINYRELIIKPAKENGRNDLERRESTGRVQDEIQRIETAEAVAEISSPLPSPRVLTTPCTPPRNREDQQTSTTNLRTRKTVKYSK